MGVIFCSWCYGLVLVDVWDVDVRGHMSPLGKVVGMAVLERSLPGYYLSGLQCLRASLSSSCVLTFYSLQYSAGAFYLILA